MAYYEVRVAGIISAAELGELEGMTVSPDGACLRLSGEVADAAALHGILARLAGLGLTLVEVTRAGRDAAPPGVVRFRGRAATSLQRRFPHLHVHEEQDVTQVSGPLHDRELLDVLGTALALRLDVLEVRRSEGAGVIGSGVTPVG
jgi:hypothetical protein